MAESRKGRDRQVRLDYAFDRLLASKLQHAYEILVPDQVRIVSGSILRGDGDEDRGDLRQSVLGQAKGRAYHMSASVRCSGSLAKTSSEPVITRS